MTGLNNLADQLQEERQDLREQLSTLRTDLAARELEIARLRLLVQQMGGTP
ncbi:hypothetical protein [Streptomyces zinciresistens]|uniref:hypothetical protein n=1 Tax=Streptomyces zinciresistens TaxID=1073330 RepID=UPI0002F6CE50|nr:hypothetical protein [Streptomyces zinciresistens]